MKNERTIGKIDWFYPLALWHGGVQHCNFLMVEKKLFMHPWGSLRSVMQAYSTRLLGVALQIIITITTTYNTMSIEHPYSFHPLFAQILLLVVPKYYQFWIQSKYLFTFKIIPKSEILFSLAPHFDQMIG